MFYLEKIKEKVYPLSISVRHYFTVIITLLGNKTYLFTQEPVSRVPNGCM